MAGVLAPCMRWSCHDRSSVPTCSARRPRATVVAVAPLQLSSSWSYSPLAARRAPVRPASLVSLNTRRSTALRRTPLSTVQVAAAAAAAADGGQEKPPGPPTWLPVAGVAAAAAMVYLLLAATMPQTAAAVRAAAEAATISVSTTVDQVAGWVGAQILTIYLWYTNSLADLIYNAQNSITLRLSTSDSWLAMPFLMAVNRLVSLLMFTPMAPFAAAMFTLAKLVTSWMLSVVETVCALLYVTPVAGALVLFFAPKILKAVAVELATPAAPHRGGPAKKATSSAVAVEPPKFSKPTTTPTTTLDTSPTEKIGTDKKPAPVNLMPTVDPSTLKWADGPGDGEWLKTPPPAEFTGGSVSAAAAAWETAGELQWEEGPGKGDKYFSGKAVEIQWPDGSKTSPNGQAGPKAPEPMALNMRPKPAAAPAAAASKPPSAQAAAAPAKPAPVPAPKKAPLPAPPSPKSPVEPLMRKTSKKNAVDETLELASLAARFGGALLLQSVRTLQKPAKASPSEVGTEEADDPNVMIDSGTIRKSRAPIRRRS